MEHCADTPKPEQHQALQRHLRSLLKAEILTGAYPRIRHGKRPREEPALKSLYPRIVVRRPITYKRGHLLTVGNQELVHNINACLHDDWREAGIRKACSQERGQTVIRPLFSGDIAKRAMVLGFDIEELLRETNPVLDAYLRRAQYGDFVQGVAKIGDSIARIVYPEDRKLERQVSRTVAALTAYSS